MNDASAANIKQILTAFQNIISICENPQWVKTVSSEDIKIAFKLGCFIEKTMCQFNEQNFTSQFLRSLRLWGDSNNKVVNYDQEFYSKICDHLLMKFFKHKSVNENVTDVAVRMYTSLFPKERLQVALRDLIMTSASFEAIFDFTVANKSVVNTDNLKHELILDGLCKDFENGKKDKIVTLITDFLSSFKVESSLSILMGILALKTTNSVTKLIVDSVRGKMVDRSILSKHFWLALLRNVEYNTLNEVCYNYKEFCESLCNFLIYIGGMMEQDEKNKWISNPDISLCPEITFDELETIFIFLCQSQKNSVKEYVISRLSEAQDCTGSSIWQQIILKCL